MGHVGHIRETADGRYLEVPDTLPDWHATSDELTSLLQCEVGKPAVVVATPHGDLALRAENVASGGFNQDEATLRVTGKLTVGGVVYSVEGPADGGLTVTPEAQDPGPAVWDTAGDLVWLVYRAIGRDDGDHVGLCTLYAAERAVRQIGWSTQNFVREWAMVRPTDVDRAPKHLQALGVVDLPPFTRRVAFKMARDGYDGTVQELRDDAAALTAVMSGGAQKTARDMLDAGFTGTAEELLVAAQALSSAPAYIARQ